MKKYSSVTSSVFASFVFLFTALVFPNPSFAQTADKLGIGTIEVPPGTDKIQAAALAKDSTATIGIIFFMSNMIKLFTVVAGLYVVMNIILASYHFINGGGDAGAYEKVRNQVTQSVIGLVLIVATYTITGLIGLIFFGDAGFILNPKLP